MIDQTQRALSVLQAVPVIGPLVFSPVKMGFSLAEMISGLAIGIIFGIGATISDAIGAKSVSRGLGSIALTGFRHSITGFGSLFYASSNLATLGIVGAFCEHVVWGASQTPAFTWKASAPAYAW